jgi:D-glycero-D-manno-heptose 1,7-bisphosphate phosphatase
MAVKLIIFGRDGILNEFRHDHVKAPEEWTTVPGAFDAMARLNQAGWHAVVATNQSGIGRGLLEMASVNAVHAHMHRLAQAAGARIDAVFFCPHAPEELCECRKPLPGMMLEIAERYGVHLRDVPMVCDTLRDLEAALAAGCQPQLVLSGRASALPDAERERWLDRVPNAQVHGSLGDMATALLARDPGFNTIAGGL